MDAKAAGILGACIIVAALIVSFTRAVPSAARDNGRYQLIRTDPEILYVTDTTTGQTWRKMIGSIPAEWVDFGAPK